MEGQECHSGPCLCLKGKSESLSKKKKVIGFTKTKFDLNSRLEDAEKLIGEDKDETYKKLYLTKILQRNRDELIGKIGGMKAKIMLRVMNKGYNAFIDEKKSVKMERPSCRSIMYNII